MPTLALKPTHKCVQEYYDSLRKFQRLGVKHEGAVRSAFQALLDDCGGQMGWKLVPAYPLMRKGRVPLQADGGLLDEFGLSHGIWEAKDTDDNLDKEIKAKFAVGYPKENILFQEPTRAVLFQNGQRYYEADLTKPEDLVHILTLFLEFAPPAIAEWEKAVDEFKDKVPQLGASLGKLIRKERETNTKFIATFRDFLQLCRASLNPNLSEAAVEEMIIQHLLTERIFRRIFSVADFVQRNVIAQEIEKVISALTSKAFSRDDFLKTLDHFYVAIEQAADTIKDFSEKQKFLNTVYERFFQGFCVEVADTHGIVYTPQPLVNFMVASIEHLLKVEFGKSLSDRNVHILDPFTGTGNFIVNLMRHIPRSALSHKYRDELHCNEVMLLPYYVAAMNVEHEFFEATGKYEPFEGICLVDTFETVEESQGDFEKVLFNEANASRVERQKKAPIRVVIANPPYNAGQVNENDNNKNRKYPRVDRRVSVTYGADSNATLLRKLSDPYVKAIRFATDRIGEAGIVCYVNNDSFVEERTFDGMRKHLAHNFDLIYVLELGGNVRKNPKLSGTTHNVFGIKVGVSINVFIKLPQTRGIERSAKIFYYAVPTDWRKESKYAFLEKIGSVANVKWKSLKPDKKYTWLTNKTDDEYAGFLPIGSKETKSGASIPAVFRTYSLGASTNRDEVVYDFRAQKLEGRVQQFIDDYNAELHRWKSKARPPKDDVLFSQYVDKFVSYEKLKWSETLKRHLTDETEGVFFNKRIRESLYRPFTVKHLYYDSLIVDRPGMFDGVFPQVTGGNDNRVLLSPSTGGRSPFWCFSGAKIPNLNFVSIDSAQCFPLYVYSELGAHRQDNITLQALTRFQNFYESDTITRREIFYYVYALLHHQAYRSRYANSLKRELPRIPFVAADGSLHGPPEPGRDSDHKPSRNDANIFHSFATAGEKLSELHVCYEQQPEYKLKRIENKTVPLDWRVEGMKLTKDRTSVLYNDFLALSGIPQEVFDYKLGNRSALEWIIDQYRVTRDQHGEIASDPNRPDDEQYIVRLIGQVITVSLETSKLVADLPEIKFT